MTVPRKRGFAAMNQEQQRAIASKGGRAAHRKGTAHQFSSEEARKAGYLGGKIVSANREHMAAIGRKGGQRAGRTAEAHGSSPVSDRHEVHTGIAPPSQLKEYPQQTGGSPSVVLPHWREAPTDSSQSSEEEHDEGRGRDEKGITHTLSAYSEATNIDSIKPEFRPKE